MLKKKSHFKQINKKAAFLIQAFAFHNVNDYRDLILLQKLKITLIQKASKKVL